MSLKFSLAFNFSTLVNKARQSLQGISPTRLRRIAYNMNRYRAFFRLLLRSFNYDLSATRISMLAAATKAA